MSYHCSLFLPLSGTALMKPRGEYAHSRHGIALFHVPRRRLISNKNVSLHSSPSITRAKADFRAEKESVLRGRLGRAVCLSRALGELLVIDFSQSEHTRPRWRPSSLRAIKFFVEAKRSFRRETLFRKPRGLIPQKTRITVCFFTLLNYSFQWITLPRDVFERNLNWLFQNCVKWMRELVKRGRKF